MKKAVVEAVGGWGQLVQDLWEKATSQVAAQCTTILQVCASGLIRVSTQEETTVAKRMTCCHVWSRAVSDAGVLCFGVPLRSVPYWLRSSVRHLLTRTLTALHRHMDLTAVRYRTRVHFIGAGFDDELRALFPNEAAIGPGLPNRPPVDGRILLECVFFGSRVHFIGSWSKRRCLFCPTPLNRSARP